MKENFGKGPTTGNQARAGKREAFKSSKQERSNLADSINSAFVARNPGVSINPKLEGVKVAQEVKPKKFSR